MTIISVNHQTTNLLKICYIFNILNQRSPYKTYLFHNDNVPAFCLFPSQLQLKTTCLIVDIYVSLFLFFMAIQVQVTYWVKENSTQSRIYFVLNNYVYCCIAELLDLWFEMQ